MDALADVFTRTRIGGAIACRSLMRAPWSIRFEETKRVGFHVVTEGTCWIKVESRPAERLQTGDVVLLCHGSAHVLSSERGLSSKSLEAWLGGQTPSDETVISGGGHGARCVVACGAYESDGSVSTLLFSQLPKVLVARPFSQPRDEGLATLVGLLVAELGSERHGRSALLARYLEAVLLHVVRQWLDLQPSSSTGWLSALNDPPIARALTMMHRHLGSDLSLAVLSKRCGLSRATFSRRFTARVGVSPGAYLQRWRVEVGAQLLRESSLSVGEVSNHVGYESEFAFNRAFRRLKGQPPGRYRKQFLRGLG